MPFVVADPGANRVVVNAEQGRGQVLCLDGAWMLLVERDATQPRLSLAGRFRCFGVVHIATLVLLFTKAIVLSPCFLS